MLVRRRLQRAIFLFSKPTPNLIHLLPSFSSAAFPDHLLSVDRLSKLINDHPFPSKSFPAFLHRHIPPHYLSPPLVDAVLGHLLSGHASAVKGLDFFRFSLKSLDFRPSPQSFERVLLGLTRTRCFDQVWELMEEAHRKHPSLITHTSLSIVLLKFAKSKSFDDTLELFAKMERVFGDGKFGADGYNILLRAFCTQRKMKEARAVFRKYHSMFEPNAKTFNILLEGFKESGNVTAVELFYHEMSRRGFRPNSATYNIMIDAYCKKGDLSRGLRVLGEMEEANISPTLETMTTLIHGACVARNPIRARKLFEEMSQRKLQPDIGAYNALLGAYIRVGDLKTGLKLMDEMEVLGIGCDDVTYYTMFWGMRKFVGIEGVCSMFEWMVEKKFVPKMRTVVMLMKLFCENGLCDLGLSLWEFLMKSDFCPNSHSLDLLVTGLCCRGRVDEAYKCFKQVVKRGRQPSERGFRVLEDFLMKAGEVKKLEKLNQMLKRLETALPLSRGDAVGLAPEKYPH